MNSWVAEVGVFGLALVWLVSLSMPLRSKKLMPALALAALLPLHALADSTAEYFDLGLFQPSTIRTLLAVGILFVLIPRIKLRGPAILLNAILFYYLILCVFSSDVMGSTMSWIKLAVPISMFTYGASLAGNRKELQTILWSLLAAGVVIIAQFALAQRYQLGEPVYQGFSLYLGGAAVQVNYTLAVLALCAPLMVGLKRSGHIKWAGLGLGVLSSIILLLFLRRGSVLGLAAGALAYITLSQKRMQAVSLVAAVAAIAIVAFPLYGDILISRVDGRNLSSANIEDEMRYQELFIVKDDILDAPAFRLVFGTEMLNSAAYFRGQMKGRQLHVDYMQLLHGSGIVGLLGYLGFHFWLGLGLYSWKPKDPQIQMLRATGLALLVATMTFGLSGPIVVQASRAAAMLMVGYIWAVRRETGGERNSRPVAASYHVEALSN